MNSQFELQLRLANERIDELHRQRALERLASAASAADPGRRSLRRSIGRSIIRLGQRLAADPSLSSARSAEG